MTIPAVTIWEAGHNVVIHPASLQSAKADKVSGFIKLKMYFFSTAPREAANPAFSSREPGTKSGNANLLRASSMAAIAASLEIKSDIKDPSMKVKITPDNIRRIESALTRPGVREVRLKIEQGQVVVLAVTVKKVE